MTHLSDKEKEEHLKLVLDELPPEFKKLADLRSYGPQLRVSHATVEVEHDWYSKANTMKLSFSYNVLDEEGVGAKNRSWKQRGRDNKFCYDRCAAHIVDVLTKYEALQKRRRQGDSIAKKRGEVLKEAFRSDPLLGGLDLEVQTSTTPRTESGSVDVEIRGKDYCGSNASLKFDGEAFHGQVDVYGLSAEQVAALMVVVRLDKLGVLDLIALSDDSILGASIRKLTEGLNNA